MPTGNPWVWAVDDQRERAGFPVKAGVAPAIHSRDSAPARMRPDGLAGVPPQGGSVAARRTARLSEIDLRERADVHTTSQRSTHPDSRATYTRLPQDDPPPNARDTRKPYPVPADTDLSLIHI